MFIGCLVVYYQLFLMEHLGEDFDLFKDHLYRMNEDIGAHLKTYYPDRNRIGAYLERTAVGNGVKITIYDVAGNKIAASDHRKGFGLNLELKNFTVVGENVIYVVELVYPFKVSSFTELNSFRQIRDVAVAMLAILIVLLIIYLHFSLVRPLATLNRGLESINYRNTRFQIPAVTYKRRDELGELARKFGAMQQRLDASYREQSEMIASISHDLKTPLTSILGFLERLLNRKLPPEQEDEYHRIIQQKARDINELVTEFNDFATADLKDDRLESMAPVDLRRFFSSICAEYRSELLSRGVQFQETVRIENGVQPALRIDPQKIRRVFANLVGNSLKYGDNLSRIGFSCTVRENQAIFSVEDNGPGVPESELKALFEKFYRLERSRSRDKGGSGLGLAICRSIVEHYGGEIRAYLPAGSGLGVRFVLPLDGLHKSS